MRRPLSVGCGQMCLLFNQIAVFFDRQYLLKKNIDILVFYAWSSSRKTVSNGTIFGWVWPSVPLQTDCMVL